MDAISAEDIGKFPNKDMGEALQCVTGVQISRQHRSKSRGAT
jgi:outer membrane receptor for ferrienterochelin and colicin